MCRWFKGIMQGWLRPGFDSDLLNKKDSIAPTSAEKTSPGQRFYIVALLLWHLYFYDSRPYGMGHFSFLYLDITDQLSENGHISAKWPKILNLNSLRKESAFIFLICDHLDMAILFM